VDSIEPLEQETSESEARELVDDFLSMVPNFLKWLEANGRKFLWRATTDPWGVYIAEILLQRTHANAVKEVYPNFINQYPGPEKLATAAEGYIFELLPNRVKQAPRELQHPAVR